MRHHIVVPLHKSGGFKGKNIELKFVLRSLERHFQGDFDITIIGPKVPEWLSGAALIQTRGGLKTALRLAANAYPAGFFWWYDDVVLLRDASPEDLKISFSKPGLRGGQTGWSKGLALIAGRLKAEGIEARDYSRPHGPYWFDKSMVDEGFEDWPGMKGKFPWESWILSKRKWPSRRGPFKQYYGAFKAPPREDCWYVNFNSSGFSESLRDWLGERFPEPSKSEKAMTAISPPAKPIPESMEAVLGRLLAGTSKVDLRLNPGNAGDAVIAKGTLEVLSKIKVDIERGAGTVLIGGGGNLACGYTGLKKVLESLPKSGKRVIILPHTVTERFELLKKFDDITVLARERKTSWTLKKRGIPTVLCHDAAFSVDYSGWLNKGGKGKLVALRKDKESLSFSFRNEAGNRDVSLEFGEGDWTPESAVKAADSFISAISDYEEVLTDRLHVAIVATSLGKKTTLLPNRYHKNKSVYEASLSDCPNCTFGRPKVFGIGWAKTGTTSLGTALRRMGFNHCSHRKDLLRAAIDGSIEKIMEAAEGYESFEDWPWILFYRELSERYPDAKFILTERDEQELCESYFNMLEKKPKKDKDTLDFRKMLYGESLSKEAVAERYKAHVSGVKEWFSNKSDRLLCVNWSKGDGWKELSEFLGVDAPQAKFPHSNKGKY